MIKYDPFRFDIFFPLMVNTISVAFELRISAYLVQLLQFKNFICGFRVSTFYKEDSVDKVSP